MPVDREPHRRLAGSWQSFFGLSTEPPLMIVAIDKSSRTLPILRAHRSFVVNFLKFGAEEVATLFASKSDAKCAGIRWNPYATWPEEKPAPPIR